MSGEDMRIDTDKPAISHIKEILYGFNAAMVVRIAANLELFDLIDDVGESATAKQIAEKKSYLPDPTERILNALIAVKFVEKNINNGIAHYKNTESGKLLTKKHPQTLVELITGEPSFFDPSRLVGLEDIIRGVKQPAEEGHGHGHSHGGHGHSHGKSGENFDNRMDGYSLNMYKMTHNTMVQYAPHLVSAIDLSCHKSALDLGGGSGVLSYALKEKYPDMEVYMNDQENTIEIAKQHFYKGLEHLNINFLPGDFTEIKIPNVDLFIMSQVLHHVEEPDKFLGKLHKLLNPGGAIMLLESLLKDDKTGPLPTMLWDLMMLTNAGADSTCMRQKSPAEYRDLLSANGFKDIRIVRTEEYCDYDIIYAKKA